MTLGAFIELTDRPAVSVYDLLLRRPIVRHVGALTVGPRGEIQLDGWHFECRPDADGFTARELSDLHGLVRAGYLEHGEHGLRLSRARVEDDRRDVAAWFGGRPEPRRRPIRPVDPLRLQALDLRDAARAAPHGRLAHLTRQADKLDAKADMLARVRRRRAKAMLLELRDLRLG